MKIIACASQLCAGKDLTCNYLAEKLNATSQTCWQRIGFANAVKKVFMEAFDVSWDFIEEWKRKSENPPGFKMPIRQCLQFIGDGFRGIQTDIWVNIALREEVPKIISDCRYLSEAQAIRDKKGLNILLWRKDFENNDPNPSEAEIKPTVEWFRDSGLEGDIRGHDVPGEHMIAKGRCNPGLFDFFIRNEGTIEDLYRKLDEMVIPAIRAYYE